MKPTSSYTARWLKADGWTNGSPFDNAWLRGLTGTVDWYQIAINKAIMPYSITYAQYLCYGAVQVADAAAAAAQAASVACQNSPRDTTSGAALNNLLSFDNQATVKTSGVDFTLNWNARLSDLGLESVPGSIGLNVTGTMLDYYV